MAKDDHLIDWTMSDAPADGEAHDSAPTPPPPPRPLAHLRRLSRRTWLLLGSVVLSAALFAAIGLPALERYRARRAVEAVVAQEAAAIHAGDWKAVQALYDPDFNSWSNSEIDRLKRGDPPPLLLAATIGARVFEPPGRVLSVKVLEPKLAQAEVLSTYPPPAGPPINLVLPQFYRYGPTGWVHTRPPAEWWGELQHYRGAHVDLDYFSVDAAYALDLGRFLDDLIGQACRQWPCPSDLRTHLNLVSSIPERYRNQWYSPVGSLVFGFVANSGGQGELFPLGAPSPQLAGLPQDAASLAATRRTLAVPVLIDVAQQALRPKKTGRFNAYFYALVVRELARLGQEDAALGQLLVANPAFKPGDLWDMPVRDFQSMSGLSEALALLNGLLAGQPLAAEAKLFQTVDATPGLNDWLAGGLGLAPGEVEARVAAALNPPVPLLTASLGDPDLALGCSNGLWLASRDGRAWPLTEERFPNSYGASWSPDGQRLAVNIAGRTALLDLAGRAAEWLPEAGVDFGTPVQWLDANVLAYEPRHYNVDTSNGQVWSDFAGVHFYDAANPARPIEPLADYSSYELSPDRTLAAAIPAGASDVLTIIPALGGEPLGAGQGGPQAFWSPDSRHVAVVRQDSSFNNWSISVIDAAGFQTRQVLAAGDPRLPPPGSDAQYVWLSVAWGPLSDELAVTASLYQDFVSTGWVGLLKADGSDFRLLSPPEANLSLTTAFYSADGLYLAVNLRQGMISSLAGIYDRASARWLRTLPDAYASGWSPTGHTLVLSGIGGTSLLSDPANPAAPPQQLTTDQCYSLGWRP